MPISGLGFGEMVLIFAVLLLLFGAKRLPELASGMGRGIRDFKRAINGLDDNSIQAGQPPAPVQAAHPATPVQAAQAPPPPQVQAAQPVQAESREG